jgi:hypothetical protein
MSNKIFPGILHATVLLKNKMRCCSNSLWISVKSVLHLISAIFNADPSRNPTRDRLQKGL